MITGVHTLVYADDAEAARAFFRDVLGWPYVDAHGGWLIFRTGPSELGVHPTSTDQSDEQWVSAQHHEISLSSTMYGGSYEWPNTSAGPSRGETHRSRAPGYRR